MLILFMGFGLRFAGDPTPFIVATILYMFCVTAFGNMIGAAIPSQVAAMQAVASAGFLLVYMLSGLLFPIQNIPAGDSLDFQFCLGPLLHRDRARRPAGRRRLAIGVAQSARDRRHRRDFLHDGVAQHAAHAVEGLSHEATIRNILGYRMRALILKEFRQILRDRRLAMSLILPPTLQLLLFGFALNATVTNLRLGVVDDSRTPESRELVANMTESKSFPRAPAPIST